MTNEQVKRCLNCGYTEEEYFPTGRCWACYQYRRRHGAERPPNPDTLIRPRVRKCVGCKKVKRIAGKERCSTCYGFQRLRESGKPERVFLAGKVCANPDCDRLIERGSGARHGRCQSCGVFWKKHARDIRQDEMTKRRKEKQT